MATENIKKMFNVNLYIDDLKTTISETKQGSQCFSGMIHQNRVVALLEEALVNLKIQQDFINKINIENYELKAKPTTEINIDYYEELKAKAYKWDEKETPYKPTGVEPFGITKIGSCKCKKAVVEDENYCLQCGQKLDWSE